MGIHGATVTAAVAASARASLQEAAREILAAAVKAPKLAELNLVPADSDVLARGILRARDELVWTNDFLCGQRALFAVHMINAAAASAGVDDAAAAGFAVAWGPFQNTVRGNRFNWDFHVAPVVHFRGDKTPSVVDFSMFREPVPLGRWENALGMPAGTAKLSNRPLGMVSGANDKQRTRELDTMASRLADTWDVAASRGFVDNPLLDARSIVWTGGPAGRGRAARFVGREYQLTG